jgi:Histidine kinase-, DNA gyrase B-, and HSP90-like ATPase
MFKVENADFIADKLAAELLPFQEYREGYKNAEEAAERRIRAERAAGLEPAPGRIEMDVDWALHKQDPTLWYLSVADNGDGMTRSEIERYTTTLAVTGANQNQSLTGNQGMGLKISGPTRHKEGILLRSLKDGERSMVQIGWTGIEYDLIPLNDNGDLVVEVPEELFPQFILEQGSGTVVTYLGSDPKANTVVPDGMPKVWLFKYMHQRFHRLGGDHVSLYVRQPARDVTEWPHSREEADAASYFNRAEVIGTGGQWDKYADRLGSGNRGTVDLPGLPSAGIPGARMHWWVLPAPGPGNDLSSRTYGGGSLAVLYQNELHDWRIGGQANAFFAGLGIIFGKQRIGLVLEPIGDGITSDFARAHVLIDGTPVFEHDAWSWWATQFRQEDKMPERIRETIVEEQQRLNDEDPDRAKRIRDRLKEVVSMLRPRRARRDPSGSINASGDEVAGSGSNGGGESTVRPVGPGTRKTTPRTRQGIGALLPQVDVDDGEPASEVFSMLHLNPRWVTEKEAEGMSLVNANGRALQDRAAALAGVDGLTAPELILSLEFRGYKSIIEHLNDWGNPDGDQDVAAAIEQATQEWIEQKMVEAITGVRQLNNGSTWTATAYDDALSPVALTATFMADRYHTIREVKRQIGPYRASRAAADAANASQAAKK